MLNRSFKNSSYSPPSGDGSPVKAHAAPQAGFSSKNPFEAGDPFYADEETCSVGLPAGWVVCEHCWLCGPLTNEASHPTDECPAKIALENEPPLHRAARYGNPDIVRRLLETGANVRKRDIMMRTPLQVAVQYKQQECTWILLTEGGAADPGTGDMTGDEVKAWQDRAQAQVVSLTLLHRLRLDIERVARLAVARWTHRTRLHKHTTAQSEVEHAKEVASPCSLLCVVPTHSREPPSDPLSHCMNAFLHAGGCSGRRLCGERASHYPAEIEPGRRRDRERGGSGGSGGPAFRDGTASLSSTPPHPWCLLQ